MKRIAMLCVMCAVALCACSAERGGTRGSLADGSARARADAGFVLPATIPAGIAERISANRAEFSSDLERVASADPDGLLVLVDKRHFLAKEYEPADLVPLAAGRFYVPAREGLALRAGAEAALDRMAAAARKDGVTLVASSTYRSYAYQTRVYERNVAELGQAAADRVSARPGASQHQLGTVVDFGSITDDFALTRAGKWLAAHAGEWGWSLSFPDGYEDATGYQWECWHYRYIGKDAAALQEKWFSGIQQYLIETIDAWKAWKAAAAVR